MKILNTAIAIVSLSFTASNAFATEKMNVTQDFMNYLNEYWIGSVSSADHEWDNTYCAVPGIGGCTQKGGSKIYGTATGAIKYLESQIGKGWVIGVNENPWTGIAVPDHWIDLKLTWYYDGESQGRKQCFPGDFFCGYEWESLHPTGRVVAKFKGDGNHLYIEMDYEVLQGHGDKPNKVLFIAMQNLKGKLKSIVEDFVHMEGSSADVKIVDL